MTTDVWDAARFGSIRARANAPRERTSRLVHRPQLSIIGAQNIVAMDNSVDNSQKPKIRIPPPSMRVIPPSSP
jgi:hypothetical protein